MHRYVENSNFLLGYMDVFPLLDWKLPLFQSDELEATHNILIGEPVYTYREINFKLLRCARKGSLFKPKETYYCMNVNITGSGVTYGHIHVDYELLYNNILESIASSSKANLLLTLDNLKDKLKR